MPKKTANTNKEQSIKFTKPQRALSVKRNSSKITKIQLPVVRKYWIVLSYSRSYFYFLFRSVENSTFVEDFSDMLLLKLLDISITASADNEKVCRSNKVAIYQIAKGLTIWSLKGGGYEMEKKIARLDQAKT